MKHEQPTIQAYSPRRLFGLGIVNGDSQYPHTRVRLAVDDLASSRCVFTLRMVSAIYRSTT